jgi:2-oxoglutarate ferredoxin oxidoreductase subunit beta
MLKFKEHVREDRLPHIWCPGCGDGTIAKIIIQAIQSLSYEKDNVMVVTGIGCSARINNIMDYNTFQSTHGRAIAFASGFKVARPDMQVVVVTGDGDGAGIGGNHLIHAARRNIDLTVILVNNYIFGMTGGQFSPLTPYGAKASTAAYGCVEYPFDVCRLVEAAGATYVARSTVYHYALTEKLIKNGLKHKGFSYIEIISQCPTTYGKRNKNYGGSSGYDQLIWQKENAVPVSDWTGAAELPGDKFLIGEFVERTDRVEYTEADRALKEKVMSLRKEGAAL